MESLFYTKESLVLASSSPRRRDFLQELGLAFKHVNSHGIEPHAENGETPEAYACRAASVKAQFVAQHHHNAVVIGADTVVALEGAIYGKPRDAAHALSMLTALAGKGHTVVSAVSMFLPSGEEVLFHDSTEVYFHNWEQKILENYASSKEPLDKAGAYAIQGQGAFLVERIVGSWTTVVGLPVTLLVQKLLEYDCISPVINK